jgi:hypothetical protein
MARETCACPGADEILTDLLEADLLELQPGERLWKLYCFRVPGDVTGLRHRIYTKAKADGRLSLVTFAAQEAPETPAAPRAGRLVRSGIARVADLSAAHLDQIVRAIQQQTASSACEEIDLSHFDKLEEQVEQLRVDS